MNVADRSYTIFKQELHNWILRCAYIKFWQSRLTRRIADLLSCEAKIITQFLHLNLNTQFKM